MNKFVRLQIVHEWVRFPLEFLRHHRLSNLSLGRCPGLDVGYDRGQRCRDGFRLDRDATRDFDGEVTATCLGAARRVRRWCCRTNEAIPDALADKADDSRPSLDNLPEKSRHPGSEFRVGEFC